MRRIYYKKELGDLGERIGCRYLENIGYKIIKKNFRCRQGEIDIIAKDKNEYVFIEVKTRSNSYYGRPREAVDRYKQMNLLRTTKYYLYINNLQNKFVRFDVIEIYIKNNKYELTHLKNVEIKGY